MHCMKPHDRVWDTAKADNPTVLQVLSPERKMVLPAGVTSRFRFRGGRCSDAATPPQVEAGSESSYALTEEVALLPLMFPIRAPLPYRRAPYRPARKVATTLSPATASLWISQRWRIL